MYICRLAAGQTKAFPVTGTEMRTVRCFMNKSFAVLMPLFGFAAQHQTADLKKEGMPYRKRVMNVIFD